MDSFPPNGQIVDVLPLISCACSYACFNNPFALPEDSTQQSCMLDTASFVSSRVDIRSVNLFLSTAIDCSSSLVSPAICVSSLTNSDGDSEAMFSFLLFSQSYEICSISVANFCNLCAISFAFSLAYFASSAVTAVLLVISFEIIFMPLVQ